MMEDGDSSAGVGHTTDDIIRTFFDGDKDVIDDDDDSAAVASSNPLMVCYFDTNDDDDDDDTIIDNKYEDANLYHDDDTELGNRTIVSNFIAPSLVEDETITMDEEEFMTPRSMAMEEESDPLDAAPDIASAAVVVDESLGKGTSENTKLMILENMMSSTGDDLLTISLPLSSSPSIQELSMDNVKMLEEQVNNINKIEDSISSTVKEVIDDNSSNDNEVISDPALLEAERQAAIAAAISAKQRGTSTKMSPSTAAGIAKEIVATPTSHPPPPLSPPKRSSMENNRYQSNGPTIVVLPPQQSSRRQIMPTRPVRFDDVKVAFHDCLSSSSSTSTMPPTTRTFKIENNTKDIANETKSADALLTTSSPPPPRPDLDSYRLGKWEEEGDKATNDVAKLIESISPHTTPATMVNQTCTKLIPDSFLKFLLHIARIPLKEEVNSSLCNDMFEGQNDTNHNVDMEGHRRIHSEPGAPSKAASQRAHEILCLTQSLYDAISDRQEQITSDDNGIDATMSFFAACAGGSNSVVDVDEMTEKMKLSNALDDKADSEYIDRELASKSSGSKLLPPPPPSLLITSSTTSKASSTASSMSSSVFSNVLSKMIMPKKQQPSFADIKKFVKGDSATSVSTGQSSSPSSSPTNANPRQRGDYEVLINHDMLGLTVENVLERTIIRTLLPDGAARHAGAQVGSLVAKVGNIDTANLTHFETIDELRRSQRPLKLSLRHVGGDVLRKARDEMGRLIRGNRLVVTTTTGIGGDNNNALDDRPWSRGGNLTKQQQSKTLDSVLSIRWPTKPSRSKTISLGAGGMYPPSLVSTRDESIQQASKSLIRILALFVIGLVKELNCLEDDTDSIIVDNVEGSIGSRRRKDLSEALEITSKILLDFVMGLPDADGDASRSTSSGGGPVNNSGKNNPVSSFSPAPPGRVQSKRHGSVPPSIAGRGGPKAHQQRVKKNSASSPLLRIGDALKRVRSFLVDYSSFTATILRWEIIDYLCLVLDLDTEQELSDNDNDDSVTNNGGDAGSPLTDLGAAGSILKLIILNCSTNEGATIQVSDNMKELSADTPQTDGPNLISGNCFLSVVHRLAASKSISARVSACSLGTVLWSHIDFPRQLQLRGVLTRALHDVEVMVRKSTAVVLHEIAELVSDRRAVPWLVLMCERSMTDPEPQLRAAAMTLTWHLADHLPNAFLGDEGKDRRSVRRLPPRDSPTFMDVYLLQCKLFPVANNLAEDRVASVRLSVAAQCDKLCTALGEHWSSVIIDLLQTLLSDADELVRSEAILCMPRLVQSVILGMSDSHHRSITVLESLLPLALKIQNDTSSMVRSSLAIASGELLIFLVGLEGATMSTVEAPPSPGRRGMYTEHKQYVDETLIPILQKLLQDSDPEVVTASLRAVTNASRSGTAREAIARTRSGSQSFTDDDLVSLSSHQSLHSHTSYDRTKPVFIPVISEKQVLRLLPTLSNLGTSKEWRVRQSAVEIVPALMGCTHEQETRHEISKLCLRLMNDKVDSVRKTAAECFCLGGSSLAQHGEEDGGEYVNTIVIPHLKTCSLNADFKQRLLSLKMTEIIIINGLCPTSRSGAETEKSISGRDDESVSDSVSSNVTGVSESERPVRIILSISATLISDKVANVRLNVGRTFGIVMTFLDQSDIEFAVETLEKQLIEETAQPGGGDRDVIAFSHQAISIAQPLWRRISSSVSN